MEKKIYLKQLSIEDGKDVYNTLQRIEKNKNDFTNPVNGMNYENFKKWLIEQNDWANGKNLPNGYVPQTIFWVMLENKPIGFAKIRHHLTSESRRRGGSAGLSIDPLYRGKGIGTIAASLMSAKAKELGVEEILVTIRKDNIPSKMMAVNQGLKLVDEDDEYLYFKPNEN